jgi:hypothetical protein
MVQDNLLLGFGMILFPGRYQVGRGLSLAERVERAECSKRHGHVLKHADKDRDRSE